LCAAGGDLQRRLVHPRGVEPSGYTDRLPGPRLTRLLAVAALALIVLGPSVRQVFGVTVPGLAFWRMYHGSFDDLCQVRFSRMDGDTEVPLSRVERLEVLGYPGGAGAPMKHRRIKKAKHADAVIRAMCRELPPGVHLRLRMRCGIGERGWKTWDDGSANVCAPGHRSQRSKGKSQ
jgi:hypothetical protein